MIEKMTTSKSIIAKVISDLSLNEDDIKISDIKSWIGEATSKIGSVNQLEHKVDVLPIKDFLCKLPCEIEKLQFVAFSFNNSCGWIPMKKSTGIFSVYDKNKCSSNCEMIFKDNVLYPLIKNMFNLTTDEAAQAKLNEDSNLRVTLSALLNNHTFCMTTNSSCTNFSNTVQYDVKPGYIITNMPEGYVKISYLALYTDEDGMPLIPDKASYAEAIYWYVAMKLMYIEYYTGRKPQHIYYDAKRSWNFYRQQAYAECLMPNENELENIKNTWHTLVPELNSHDTYFSTIGDAQTIYN